MLRIRVKYSIRECLLVLLFYSFLLQHMMNSQIPIFNYVDECAALLGLLFVGDRLFVTRKVIIQNAYFKVVLSLTVFAAVGLLANVLYEYQPTNAVLKDLVACLKYFFAIIAGYELFREHELESGRSILLPHARIAAFAFSIMLLFDLTFQIFPSHATRYGIRVVQLLFSHPTYLASASVFLLGILTIFYQKKNNLYIALCVILMFFTLRGKAIAGAAVYVALFFFVLHRRTRIRLVHILSLGILALIVAWEQFSFYYIELADESARAMLTRTSFEILKDYFPIGTGFGTYASNVAAEFYSPVYFEYGLYAVYGLSQQNTSFGSDTFWPIILGQTGLIGTIAYLTAQITLFLQILKVRTRSNAAYTAGMFLYAYLLISSTSESAFCNAMSVPFAILIGGILTLRQK